jgi:hypothetical protein
MRSTHLSALVALLVVPVAARADDILPLYPDSAVFAFGIDVKGITSSPLGKKVIGDDKPYDATRKLLRVMFPEDILPVAEEAAKPLAQVANRLDRATIVGHLFTGGGPKVVIFLEGDIGEDDYIKAAEAIAKAENKEFKTEQLGEQKLLLLGSGNKPLHGLRVRKSLFIIATERELIDEVLDKHAGKKKANVQKGLTERVVKVKPAETPIWLAVGQMKDVLGIDGGIATIGLKSDVDFRIEINCDEAAKAADFERLLNVLVAFLADAKTPQGKVWHAAGIKVTRDGTTVVATGSIPAKLLIDEYAKQK